MPKAKKKVSTKKPAKKAFVATDATPNNQWAVDLRPSRMSDLLLPPAVKATVKGILAKPPKTIFISGASGLGKTTIAKMIAAKLTSGERDVLVFNCAKEEGIAAVRDLLGKLQYLPIKANTRRVVILDEVQSLSKQAAQTVLDPLESDTNPHVTFILCTDQPGRVLGTIKSRGVQINLAPPSVEALAVHLRDLASFMKCLPKKWSQEDLVGLFMACAEAGNGNIRAAITATQTCLNNIEACEAKSLKDAIKKDLLPPTSMSDLSPATLKALFHQLTNVMPEKRKIGDVLGIIGEVSSTSDPLSALNMLIEASVHWVTGPTAKDAKSLAGVENLLMRSMHAKDQLMTVPASGWNEAKARLVSVLMSCLVRH